MTASAPTSLHIEFELGESDLAYFRKRLEDARQSHAGGDEAAIIAGAEATASAVETANPPAYVRDRLAKLVPLIAMLRDADWRLEGDDRARVLDALAYFADPHDLIPDSTPGIGFLDDAIMIELVALELAPEIEAYADFVAHREDMASAGDPEAVSLEEARRVLQSRMRRRRRRGRGYSPASGGGGFRFTV